MKNDEVEFKKFIAKDGNEIAYIDVGEGKPFIFIHGFGGSSEVQMPIFNLLKDKFRCLCFDQRGYGKTPGKGEVSIYQSARDTRDLIEHLDLKDVVFLGYSMGAAVMFSYIEQFGTDRIERAIIGEMTPKTLNDDEWNMGFYQGWYREEHLQNDLKIMKEDYIQFAAYLCDQLIFPHTPDEVRTFKIEGELEDYIEYLKEKAGTGKATVDAMLAVKEDQIDSNIAYWSSMMTADFRETLPKMDIPVALIYAIPGSCYDERVADYMAEHLEDVKKYPFEDSTHMLKSEQLDKFIDSIVNFTFD